MSELEEYKCFFIGMHICGEANIIKKQLLAMSKPKDTKVWVPTVEVVKNNVNRLKRHLDNECVPNKRREQTLKLFSEIEDALASGEREECMNAADYVDEILANLSTGSEISKIL